MEFFSSLSHNTITIMTEEQKQKHRDSNKRWRQTKKTSCFSVYYLPEEHYVGITNSLYLRMKDHNDHGKITEGYVEIARFERKVDAAWFEILFHKRGYNGFNKGNQR